MSFLFGSNSTPQVNYTPSGFSNPTGFNVSGRGDVSESPTLASNVGNLQSTFGQGAAAFGALGQTVQPGFSQLRQAGLRDISNAFRANRSNLQDTLAQRRILGSSFANSAFSEQAATEAQTKADFEAQSYLQELSASQQLIQSQYSMATQQFSTAIGQSNIESAAGAQLTSQFNQLSEQAAQTNAQLQAQSQAAQGKGIGSLLGAAAAIGLAPFTGGASLAALPGVLAGTGGGFGGGGGGSGSVNFTNPFGGSGGVATVYPNPNVPGGFAPGYS